MTRIYKVHFEEKWKGCSWTEDTLNVAGNGDMTKVIAKVRRNRLAQTFRTDEGKTEKCIGFRPLGVTVIASSDI